MNAKGAKVPQKPRQQPGVPEERGRGHHCDSGVASGTQEQVRSSLPESRSKAYTPGNGCRVFKTPLGMNKNTASKLSKLRNHLLQIKG